MTETSRSLVEAALESETAFAAIVDRHKSMVYSIAHSFFHDRAGAEDLAQDVFLELFRNLGTIESDAHLANWLRQAAARKCIDQARRRHRHPHASLEEVAEPSSEPRPHDPFLAALLRKRLLALPARRRLILILRFQEDLELEEIARLLRIPLNTVKSTLHRTLAALNRRLSFIREEDRYGTARG